MFINVLCSLYSINSLKPNISFNGHVFFISRGSCGPGVAAFIAFCFGSLEFSFNKYRLKCSYKYMYLFNTSNNDMFLKNSFICYTIVLLGDILARIQKNAHGK